MAPNLVVGDDGKLYLSWIEPAGEAHALRFSTWEGGGWSEPRQIASGEGWFVNWADFPSLAAAADGTLAAHWLVRSGDSTYAYDVKLAVSRDGGSSWSDPVSPHDDGTPTEHGFVSMVPVPDGGFQVVWLDGRETAADGAMTLRSTILDHGGRVGLTELIDRRVCDCCPTDLVLDGDDAAVVAFRDRSPSEIRDIAVARQADDRWATDGPVHEDGWEIAACPVNGPALAATSRGLAIAWFTAPDERGHVNVAFSTDGGRSFGRPVGVDGGDPVGRVDLVGLQDGTAVVSWLESGTLWLRWIGPEGPLTKPLRAASIENSRSSGFPRMALLGRELFLAWTEPGEPSWVRTARLPATPAPPT
jgi:hypothetical protein